MNAGVCATHTTQHSPCGRHTPQRLPSSRSTALAVGLVSGRPQQQRARRLHHIAVVGAPLERALVHQGHGCEAKKRPHEHGADAQERLRGDDARPRGEDEQTRPEETLAAVVGVAGPAPQPCAARAPALPTHGALAMKPELLVRDSLDGNGRERERRAQIVELGQRWRCVAEQYHAAERAQRSVHQECRRQVERAEGEAPVRDLAGHSRANLRVPPILVRDTTSPPLPGHQPEEAHSPHPAEHDAKGLARFIEEEASGRVRLPVEAKSQRSDRPIRVVDRAVACGIREAIDDGRAHGREDKATPEEAHRRG
eukprot:CAMPEP_0119421982 /NCGR_PEP_ID=MMETSP1335-20130426/27144_1 /TAXON_ID=259385 /ORGANISM="Chrysoculter rhomboideus, Strain RCC1486" /LENGTH=310 /DNA_ID=CAMNT_0007447409 /DNA_START=103 /DNA_END=1032 /DNA_ORIENTATION=-